MAVPALCSRRVLAMSWIEGAPHPNPEALNLAAGPTLALALTLTLTLPAALTRRAAAKARLGHAAAL